MIQIGTLAAVLAYFWRDVVRILSAMLADLRRGKLATTHDAMLGWMIAVGTLPIVVCGLAFKDEIETTLRSLYVVSAALIGLAVLLAMVELVVRRRIAAGEPGRGRGRADVAGCDRGRLRAGGGAGAGDVALGGDDFRRAVLRAVARGGGAVFVPAVDPVDRCWRDCISWSTRGRSCLRARARW